MKLFLSLLIFLFSNLALAGIQVRCDTGEVYRENPQEKVGASTPLTVMTAVSGGNKLTYTQDTQGRYRGYTFALPDGKNDIVFQTADGMLKYHYSAGDEGGNWHSQLKASDSSKASTMTTGSHTDATASLSMSSGLHVTFAFCYPLK